MYSTKTLLSISPLLFTVVLIACSKKKTAENYQAPVDSVTIQPTQELTAEAESPSDSTVAEDTESYDCPLAEAQPVVKKSIYPQSVFKISKDGRTATETVALDRGEQLIVKRWGCEYYVLTFRFETTRFKGDTTDLMYWLDKAVTMMNEVEKGIDVPIDIPGGTAAALTLAKEKRNYLLGEEIVYHEGSIRSFVTFDRVQKIDDAKFAVEISYASGPY